MTAPTLVTTVTTLEAPFWNGSQWVRQFGSDETVLPGDSLIVLIGGGNKVEAYPGGDWQQLDYQTGQEAQGFVMARRFTADPEATTWTCSFDGTDKSLVSVLHFRGEDVAWEVDAALRSGAVGVTQPAGSVDITGPGKGDMEFYFAFARNSFGDMPTADGDTLFAESLGNETGALYRDLPTVTDTKHVGLPSRTGHYVVALGVFIPTPGPWRDDSVEFWGHGQPHPTLRPAVDPRIVTFDTEVIKQSSFDGGHTTAQASADAAWAGTGTGGQTLAAGWQRSSFEVNDTTPIGGPPSFPVSWKTTFISIARGDGHIPGHEGQLPDTVYDPDTDTYLDPEVRSVEWEANPSPLDQRLHIETLTNFSFSSFDPDVDAVTVYGVAEDAGAPLGPTTFQTRGAIVGTEALWTSDASEDETYYTGGLLGDDPAAPLRLRLVALENVTATGAVPSNAINTSSLFAVDLQQLYRPQYRLIYRHAPNILTRAVARLWPRDDGQGISTAPRIWPPTKANRIVGGYQ